VLRSKPSHRNYSTTRSLYIKLTTQVVAKGLLFNLVTITKSWKAIKIVGFLRASHI